MLLHEKVTENVSLTKIFEFLTETEEDAVKVKGQTSIQQRISI